MNPLVTIAIPAYNLRSYLAEALGSALAQTYAPLEIIVGDDASTEWTEEEIRPLVAVDPRVRYHRNPSNLGYAGNCNALADLAQGAYLNFLHGDDRLLPNFIERLVQEVDSAPQVIFCNQFLIDERGIRLEQESIEHTRRFARDTLAPGKLPIPGIAVWQNSISIQASLVRTADLRRMRFKEDIPDCPEIEFFARLAQEGGKFVFVPAYLMDYRIHPLSATARGAHMARLAEYLLEIEVAPEIEPYKRAFMAEELVSAVNRSLLLKQHNRARKFLTNEYYPKSCWTHASCLAQRICAGLPAFMGCSLYHLMHQLRASPQTTALLKTVVFVFIRSILRHKKII
jgi:glycosyltransferase involved in cell wall biosynthesis